MAPALYGLISFGYFGLPVVRHPGSRAIGSGTDPFGFIWALAWWPHAVLHGHEPIVSHAIWAPSGFDLAWSTAIPSLALLFAPLTLTAGPVVAYNVAALLMPPLAAWAAYRLCLRLTRRFWPSLVGGYLFGFSSYELGQQQGHLQLTPVFTLPLTALLILRYLDGSLAPKRFVVYQGLLLAFAVGASVEVAFTLTLALVLALALGYAIYPERRPQLRSLSATALAAYALAAVICSPLLYFVVTDFHSGGFSLAGFFPGDALNVVVPTGLIGISGRWASNVAAHYRSNDAENGLYLGLPILVALGWYAVLEWRSRPARLLGCLFALFLVASLGQGLYVEGRRVGPAPWALVAHLPLFDNVVAPRLSAYTALVASVVVALWGASTRTSSLIRIAVLWFAVLSLVPRAFVNSPWEVSPTIPPFFATGGAYRSCLEPNANVLVLPNVSGALLWQARDGFRYRLAAVDFQPDPPPGVKDRAVMIDIQRNIVPPGGGKALLRFARANAIDDVVAQPTGSERWRRALAPLAHARRIQGVWLYRLSGAPPGPGCG